MDATLIPVPRQRNTREENQTLKQGEVPGEWPGKPHKFAQKDVDTRWTKKHGTSDYGYKNHVSSDVGFKFIRRYTIIDASVHDLQVLGPLLDADNNDDGLWADSAYLSVWIIEVLTLMGFEPHINERSYCNQPKGRCPDPGTRLPYLSRKVSRVLISSVAQGNFRSLAIAV